MKLRLAEFRERQHMTQNEVAKIAGVSPKTEWNWEQGKSFPNASQLWDIAVALNTSPNELMGWYDEHPADAASPPPDPMERELSELFKECTVQRKRRLVEYARDAAAMSKDAAERDSSVVGQLSEAM